MNAPDRPNNAKIHGTDRGAEITLYNPKGSMAGWSWDAVTKTLSHTTPGFQPAYRFNAETTAAFDAAVADVTAAYKPGTYERLTGLQLSQLPEADREGFEWDGNMDDDAGHYVHSTPPVVESRSVRFGRLDIVETIPKVAAGG